MPTRKLSSEIRNARSWRSMYGGVLRWVFLFWVSLFWCSAAPTLADRISIVLSASARPYQNMAESLEKKLAGSVHEVTILLLKDLKERASFEADLFVGVGSGATGWLLDHLPENKPLVYWLVTESPGLERAFGIATEVHLKEQFALIQEALPRVRNVGVLYASSSGSARMARLEKELPEGVSLTGVAVDQHPSFARALDQLFAQGVDIIWTEPDPKVYSQASVRSLLLAALRRRVPVFGFSANFVRSGSLLGVDIDLNKYSDQVVRLCENLLKDGRPSFDFHDPPRPAYHVVVNLVVARKLSIRLPESLIERASILSGL